MNEKIGQVYNIEKDNQPVAGCTISKLVSDKANKIFYFSLAKDTDISNEIFPYYKFIYVVSGKLNVLNNNQNYTLSTNESFLTSINGLVGFKSSVDTIYLELEIKGEDVMNNNIKAGEIFKLENLVPYQEGKIVNMDVMHNDTMKFVVMSFDEGLALSEHAAPGEAMIFALDGEGIITYEGVEHKIRKGENFCFAKGGLHAVKALTKFKMALILSL